MLSSGPNNYNSQFVVANDGLVSLATPPFSTAGGVISPGPVVIKNNTAPTLPAPLGGTLLQLGGVDGTPTRLEIDGFAQTGALSFRRANGTAGARAAVLAGDVIGSFGFSGYGATGYGERAYLNARATENWTDIAQGTSFEFTTTLTGALGPNVRMLIDGAGNVGIGTTAPSNKLDVVGAIRSTSGGNPTTGAGIELNYNPSTGPGTAFVLSYDRTAAAYRDLSINGAALTIWARGTATFSGDTNMLFNVGAERMRIDASGNVGIGTSAPGARLHSHVAGAGMLGLFLSNATYSTTAFNGLGMQVNDTGAAIIRGGWGTAKDILLNDAGGNVGIGTSPAGYKLDLNSGAGLPMRVVSSYADDIIRFENTGTGGRTYHVGSSGSASGAGVGFTIFDVTAAALRLIISPTGVCSNSGGAWTAISDISTKSNVSPYDRGLDAILKLKPVSFIYNERSPFADDESTVRYGLVAQEVEPFVPEAVGSLIHYTESDGHTELMTLDVGHFTYLLINAMKTVAARLDKLEALESKTVH